MVGKMETKDNIELPPLHYDELPEPDDPIPAMHNYARRAIKADRQKRIEPVAWIVPDFGFLFPSKDAAERYLSNVGDARKPTPVYVAPQSATPKFGGEE